MKYPAFFLSFFVLTAFAQEPLQNKVYDADVRTVQFYVNGLQLSVPIVNLNAGNGILQLEFDHLGDALMDYEYSITHCNSDWRPSDLQEDEYINGFREDRITDINNSFNTLQAYTHYRLGLPNANMRFTQSGNYILKVWDSNNEDQIVLTRRFMVAETNTWSIRSEFIRPFKVDKINTHHEIDFTVIPKNTRGVNTQNDVKAYVMQNSRWDNMIGPIKPYITRGEELVFDWQDLIVFPAGKEFRFFDIRSFDLRGENVRIIKSKPTYYEVTLQRDESRADRPVLFWPDANGGFVIENKDFNQSYLQCDYAEVLFAISQNIPLETQDVYVFGGLSDWQLLPEFKMQYDQTAKAYYCLPFLKQGYYNYQYVLVDRETGKIDEEGFEGNWHETGNAYTILVYFKPFGSRFERLIAAQTMDYAKRN